MFGKKKVLILAIVTLMFSGAVLAGTALEIRQPVSATVTIAGLGNSPSFNIIDNQFNSEDGKAGAAAGYIADDDVYVIGFGAGNPGGDWALSFGRSQSAIVGDATDFVFKLQNNYANPMTVALERTGGALGNGVVIQIVKADGNVQWTLTGASDSNSFTVTGDPLELSSAGEESFYVKVINTDAVAGTYNPGLRFTVTAD